MACVRVRVEREPGLVARVCTFGFGAHVGATLTLWVTQGVFIKSFLSSAGQETEKTQVALHFGKSEEAASASLEQLLQYEE